MRRPFVLYGCLVLTVLGTSNCMPTPEDYSPHYASIPVETPSGRVKKVMVPEACLTAAEKEDVAQEWVDNGERRLPPGCANNYNLQRMAERKRDLVKGRPLGKASGAVTARAVQKYMNKEGTPMGGGVEQGSTSAGSGTESAESAASKGK
jgi:hypothetical protein